MMIFGVVTFVVGVLFGIVTTAVLSADRYTEDGRYRAGYDDGYQAGRLDEAEDRAERL